jgi:hypothetical protein
MLETFELTAAGKLPAGFHPSPADRPDALAVTEEAAAAGKKSLKLTKVGGLKYGFQPHVYFSSDRYRSGKLRFACDLLNSSDKPSESYVGLRDYTAKGREYLDGPSILIKPDGSVTASGKAVAAVPPGKWAHLEILLDLGQQDRPAAPKSYRLALTVAGGQERVFEGVPYAHPEFKQFTWFGFSSVGKLGSVFYVDNVKLELLGD